ncbi:MAG TPA: PAS domain S-box protein [Pyrinomonadaceae bacterium]|jgi:PAS domain S-box-containing protein
MSAESIKVLLIEDDEDDYILTREMLSETESCHFDVTWASTFDEAVARLNDNGHDICLIDYHLGEKSGIELLREANARARKPPAILLTGKDDPSVDDKALHAGATDYLIKGQITGPLLERSIRYAIERSRTLKSLSESEKKYRQIIETAMEGIWMVDSEGRTTYANHRTLEMLGYSMEEMLGQPAFDFMNAESNARAKKEFEEHRRQGTCGQYEYCLKHKNGTPLWVIMSTTPIFGDHGVFIGAFAMITDISERKREEEENKRLLKDLKERVKELGAIHKTARILQTQEKEITELLKEVVEILPPALQYPEIAAARVVYNGFEFSTSNFSSTDWKQSAEFSTINGVAGGLEVVYLEERPEADEGPFLAEERSLLNSVTEMLRLELDRRLATSALLESEAQMERAQSFALVMTTHVGLDGRWLKVTPTLCELLGYTEDELLKLSYQDLTHPDDVSHDIEQHERLLRGELKSYDLEKRYIRRDGGFVWVYLNCSLVIDSKGNSVHFLTYIIDISERKRVTEERNLFFTNAHDMLCIAGFDGYFKQVNSAWCRTLGYTDEELLSVPYMDFVHPDDRAATVETARLNCDGFNMFSFQNRYRAKDGSYRWLSWSSTTSKDLPIIYGSARDITERKLTEEKLQESERRFRHLAENINEVFWIATPDRYEVLYVSPAYEEIWGRTCESLYERGDSFIDVIYHEDRDRMRRVFERLRQGENKDEQYRIVRPDGSIRWIRDRAYAVKDEEGTVIQVVGIAEDITERRMAQERIHEADQRAIKEYKRLLDRLSHLASAFGTARDLQTIFRALSDFSLSLTPSFALVVCLYDEQRSVRNGVYVFSDGKEFDTSGVEPIQVREGPVSRAIKTGDVVTCNDYHAELGARRHVFVGFDNDDKLPLSALIAPMTIMGRTIGTIEVQSYTYAAYTQEHATAMRMAANLAANAIENVRLIEQERAKEEQLRQSQKMEAVGRLAGGVAHDFNNLLTAITGYSDLSLRRLEGNNPLRRNIEEIRKAADRAANLTRQLLAFSRKQVLQPKVLNLNDVVSDMDKMLRRLIGEDVDLLCIPAPALGCIKADPGQIEQVIMNLVVNSRDAMPRGGKLTIEAQNIFLDEVYAGGHVPVLPGAYVMLMISDTGCGMDQETQARIFEPFFTTKEQGKGTGLGLSTVYGIVKQSGGYVWVYSEVGCGTTFKIYLPRVDGEAQAEITRDLLAPLPQGTETVLLVEDEEIVRRMARQVLEMNGYCVLEAGGAREAIEICEQYKGPIHLLLTDVVMPQMGGKELAGQINALRRQIKVLFMSGYTNDAIVHHGVLDRNVAFLQKPFMPSALAHRVREVLNQSIIG